MAVKRIRNDAWEVDHQYNRGTKAMNTTLDNTAVADQTGGVVRLTSTAHGFAVGTMVRIAGTTNYDGVHKIKAVAANTFDIYATFVAETPAGTETVHAAFQVPQGKEGKLMEIRMHLSAAGGAAEAYTVTLDSGENAAFDMQIDTVADTTSTTDNKTSFTDQEGFLDVDDAIIFAYANTNNRTWGIELIYRIAA